MHKINDVTLSLINGYDETMWGFTHENSTEHFDPLYSGPTIFHDVFEHWVEDKHKYFKDDYAFNIGGEMFAMGAMSYFFHDMYVHNRVLNLGIDIHEGEEAIFNTCMYQLIDFIENDADLPFGGELRCNVPKQKWCDSMIDTLVDRTYEKVLKSVPVSEECSSYKNSITKDKLERLFRFGYRKTESMIPNTWENRIQLDNFISYWDAFCENVLAEELQEVFKSVRFKIYKHKEQISYRATLINRYYYDKPLKLTFDIEKDIEAVKSKIYALDY